MKKTLFLIFSICLLVIFSANAHATDEIGRIVALRGKAITERNNMVLETKLKDGIFLIDTVTTKEASKTKMLFVDDSILTIGENSRLVVKEFVYGKDDRGRSIFNLLEGKMRAVVGRTNFEVRTPTLAAAARGTIIYFETGVKGGKQYTTVISLEGTVDVRSIDPTVTGTVVLSPGMMVTVRQHEPLPSPSRATKTAVRSAAMTKGARSAKDDNSFAIEETLKTTTMAPTINQQPAQLRDSSHSVGPAPVNVGIVFH